MGKRCGRQWHITVTPLHAESGSKKWQEITCYIDQRWQGTIEQIAILNADQGRLRGDVWIDWIEISDGSPEPIYVKPDVASSKVVPKVTIPGISQAGFADAFKVLDEAIRMDVPIYGFNYLFSGLCSVNSPNIRVEWLYSHTIVQPVCNREPTTRQMGFPLPPNEFSGHVFRKATAVERGVDTYDQSMRYQDVTLTIPCAPSSTMSLGFATISTLLSACGGTWNGAPN